MTNPSRAFCQNSDGQTDMAGQGVLGEKRKKMAATVTPRKCGLEEKNIGLEGGRGGNTNGQSERNRTTKTERNDPRPARRRAHARQSCAGNLSGRMDSRRRDYGRISGELAAQPSAISPGFHLRVLVQLTRVVHDAAVGPTNVYRLPQYRRSANAIRHGNSEAEEG